jgi:hypothetical protein
VLLNFEQLSFHPMMIQELQQLAVVIDHRHLVEDHSKTCHVQYSGAKDKESENENGEEPTNEDHTLVGCMV